MNTTGKAVALARFTVRPLLGGLFVVATLIAPAPAADLTQAIPMSVAEDGEFKFKGPGTAEFSARLPGGGVYDVFIELDRADRACNMFVVYQNGGGWGNSAFFGVSTNDNYIKLISVHFGGKKIPVPISAYLDLMDVSVISYEIVQNQLYINLKMGDGGSSSRARLTFNQSGKLISRRAYHAVFAEEFWEETKYLDPAWRAKQ